MIKKITYRQMIQALKDSTIHWGVNCNLASKPETKLTLDWFNDNCQSPNCALCRLLHGLCFLKCPLDDFLSWSGCCKEWAHAYKSACEDTLTIDDLLKIEARLQLELKKRRGIRGLYYRLKWRLT